jgi:hypothetical protein
LIYSWNMNISFSLILDFLFETNGFLMKLTSQTVNFSRHRPTCLYRTIHLSSSLPAASKNRKDHSKRSKKFWLSLNSWTLQHMITLTRLESLASWQFFCYLESSDSSTAMFYFDGALMKSTIKQPQNFAAPSFRLNSSE